MATTLEQRGDQVVREHRGLRVAGRVSVQRLVVAVISLDRHLTEVDFAGGFDAVTVETLNGYLRTYHSAHTQGGTNTKQRNLAVFFTRNRGALTSNGIYQLLRRRAEQAGYDRSAIRPHLFRHTRAHQHLADGGAEGDLMRHMSSYGFGIPNSAASHASRYAPTDRSEYGRPCLFVVARKCDSKNPRCASRSVDRAAGTTGRSAGTPSLRVAPERDGRRAGDWAVMG